MLANIDLDGVVYPFHNSCRSLAEHWLTHEAYPRRGSRSYAPVRLPDPQSWNLWDEWGISREDWDGKFWPWAVEHGVFNQMVPPIGGAREGIAKLRDMGWEIRFVTHKPTQGNGFKHHAIRDAVQWLSWNRIEYDSIVFDGDKTRYQADLIVDDNPDLTRWVQTYATNLLFDQPWNRDTRTFHNVLRVNDWTDVCDLANA